MIRLSRRAWNNVIIFAMLIMILLFNTTTNILTGSNDSENESVPMLPEDSVLMTLELGPQKIERIGMGWRTNPATHVTEAELVSITSTWQSANMRSSDSVDRQSSLIVIAWLAGESKGRVYQFIETQQGLFVYVDKQYFRLEDVSIDQLILPGAI